MGNKLCTSANKEDKLDAKAERKENDNRPVEKEAEQPEVREVATVEISREEVVEANAEPAPKTEENQVSTEEADKTTEVTEAVTTEVVEVQETQQEVVEEPPTDVQPTNSSPPDDIREDIVQAVTIETVKLSVTEYIEDDAKEGTTTTQTVTTTQVVEKPPETYDSPDDIVTPKENFLLKFRNENEIHEVDFIRIWKNYDQDCSGYLEKGELHHFMKDLLAQKGHKNDEETVSAYGTIMMERFDVNNDGKLEMSELAQLLPVERNFLAKYPGRSECRREDFSKIFDHFDKDNSGSIGHTELLALMKDMFEKNGPHHMQVTDVSNYADGIFAIYDTDQDGRLSKDEVALVLSRL